MLLAIVYFGVSQQLSVVDYQID